MKIKTNKQHRLTEDGLISLINVIFLLLIFFMLMGQIEPPETLRVELPLSATVEQKDKVKHQISIDNLGEIFIDGKIYSLDGVAEIAAVWSKQLALGEEPSLSIKADAKLHNGVLTPLLNVLREAGWNKVKLAVFYQ